MLKNDVSRDSPGSPVVKTSPSTAGGAVQSLVREIPYASQPKNERIKQK